MGFMAGLKWRRLVLKVGSALIAPEAKGCSTRYLLAIAGFISASAGNKGLKWYWSLQVVWLQAVLLFPLPTTPYPLMLNKLWLL